MTVVATITYHLHLSRHYAFLQLFCSHASILRQLQIFAWIETRHYSIYKFSSHMTTCYTRHMTAQPLCFSFSSISICGEEMKKTKPQRRNSLTRKLFRSLGGGTEVLSSPLSSQEETHAGIPVNSLDNYSSEAQLKKAQALMYQRMFDRPK